MSDRGGGPNVGAEQAAAAALLADNSTYHNHKEQMAYLGAVAYIGACAAFIFSPRQLPLQCSSLALLIFTAAVGLLYVWWQLRRRDEAAVAAQGYYNILVRALPEGDVTRKHFARKPVTWLPKVLMLVAMLVWAICALYPALRTGCV
jgi:hypothetical protein